MKVLKRRMITTVPGKVLTVNVCRRSFALEREAWYGVGHGRDRGPPPTHLRLRGLHAVCCCGDEYRHHDDYGGHDFVTPGGYRETLDDRVRPLTGEVHEDGTRWRVTLADDRACEVTTDRGWVEVRASWETHESGGRTTRAVVEDAELFAEGSLGARLQAQRDAVRKAALEIAEDWKALGGSGVIRSIASVGRAS